MPQMAKVYQMLCFPLKKMPFQKINDFSRGAFFSANP